MQLVLNLTFFMQLVLNSAFSILIWLVRIVTEIVTAKPQSQPNSTSTRVGVDKVISWTTTHHHPSKTFKQLPD
jgi:hypothetical protein